MDKFLIEDSNVGELASLRIELVKSGLSSDWFLEHISIQEWGSKGTSIYIATSFQINSDSLTADSPIVFHCNQWIRADVNTARDGREKGVQLFGADNQTIPAQASDRDPCLTSPSQSNTASNTRSDNDSELMVAVVVCMNTQQHVLVPVTLPYRCTVCRQDHSCMEGEASYY